MSEVAERAKSIFLKAVEEYAPNEWRAYLNGACGSDAELRARVEDLLNAHAELGTFREQGERDSPTVQFEAPREKPGEVIGPYKLLQEIGKGGFGVVYMAEQQQPVQRKVALKIIKPGMDTREVIARFEAERQALAMMDHPNIARVLDAGATDSGRPYFVMELVRGVRITKYCDEANLTTEERLQLFVTVCQAVQHAHHKGIIHRDIKPSNVMITLHDGKPVVKVIDFGIAKAINQKLTERTLFTNYAQMIGTPLYMSPEQAEMSGLDVDTRTDVYSLGVLLYELLTGTTPFDKQRLSTAAYDEIRRIIREEDPPKPSTKVSTQLGDSATEICSKRNTDPRKLSALMRGELDWIVMKALEKDRSRRYESPNSFAADIDRYMNDEPVEACPPSASYRLRKLIRRNRAAMTSVILILLSLTTGIVLVSIEAVRANRAEALAANRFEAAEKSSQRAEAARASEEAQRLAAEKARTEAESARNAAEMARDAETAMRLEARRNLYVAEMSMASEAASDPGGSQRMRSLLDRWYSAEPKDGLPGWEWYYLRGLDQPASATLRGHFSWAQWATWSPDDRYLATCGDFTVRVWDAVDGREIARLGGLGDYVWEVDWSPDGRYLASADGTGTITLWNFETNQQVAKIKASKNQLRTVAWHSNGQWLASAGPDHTIRIWDVETQKLLHSIEDSDIFFENLAWSPNMRMLAGTGYGSKSLGIWKFNPKDVTLTAWRHLGGDGHRQQIAWSPDSRKIAGTSSDKVVSIWDVETGNEIAQWDKHESWVGGIAWSSNGKWIASAGADRRIVVQDATTGEVATSWRGHSNTIVALDWNSDDSRVVSASQDRSVRIWEFNDANTGNSSNVLTRNATVHCIGWSPDSRHLAWGDNTGTVEVWDSDADIEPTSITSHESDVRSVAWSSDGNLLASASDNDIQIKEIPERTEVLNLTGLSRPENELGRRTVLRSLAWRPKTFQVAGAACVYHNIRLWDAHTGHTAKTMEVVSGWLDDSIGSMSWHPRGNRFLSAGGSRQAWIWSITEPRPLVTLRGHGDAVGAVAWNPQHEIVATASFDGTVRLWDAGTGGPLAVLEGHTGPIFAIAWNPTGDRLVSGAQDGTLRIWDPRTKRQTLVLEAHAGGVLCVAWSPNGMRIASGGEDSAVKIWDALPGHRAVHSREVLNFITDRQGLVPDSTSVYFHKAVVRAHAGNWAEAAKHWQDAMRTRPEKEREKWFTSGWWTQGPINPSSDNETEVPIFHLETAKEAGAKKNDWELPWQPVAVTANGALNQSLQSPSGDLTCMHAAARIYTPQNCDVSARLFTSRPLTFWHDQSRVYHADRGRPLDADDEFIPLSLAAGWNTFLFRIDTGTSEDYFRFVLSDSEADLQIAREQQRQRDAQAIEYLHDWLVLTPNPPTPIGVAADPLELRPFDFENDFAPRDGDHETIDGLDYQWKAYRSDEYFFKADKMQSAGDKIGVVYAVCYLTVESDTTVQLAASGENLMRAYLNGEAQFEQFGGRFNSSPVMTKKTVPITLREGTNSLLVKIVNLGAGRRNYLRLSDENGRPVPGIKVSLTP